MHHGMRGRAAGRGGVVSIVRGPPTKAESFGRGIPLHVIRDGGKRSTQEATFQAKFGLIRRIIRNAQSSDKMKKQSECGVLGKIYRFLRGCVNVR